MADGIKKEERRRKPKSSLFNPPTVASAGDNKKDLELVQKRVFPEGSRSGSIVRVSSLDEQAPRLHLSTQLRCANACHRSALAGERARVAWSAVSHGDGEGLRAIQSEVCQLSLHVKTVPRGQCSSIECKRVD